MDDLGLISTAEAARLAGCSPCTIIRWVLHDGLKAYRRRTARGWRYRVSRRALLERLELVQERGRATGQVGTKPESVAVLKRFGLA